MSIIVIVSSLMYHGPLLWMGIIVPGVIGPRRKKMTQWRCSECCVVWAMFIVTVIFLSSYVVRAVCYQNGLVGGCLPLLVEMGCTGMFERFFQSAQEHGRCTRAEC